MVEVVVFKFTVRIYRTTTDEIFICILRITMPNT